MGHFSMEIYAPNGSNLSGNQQTREMNEAVNNMNLLILNSYVNVI